MTTVFSIAIIHWSTYCRLHIEVVNLKDEAAEKENVSNEETFRAGASEIPTLKKKHIEEQANKQAMMRANATMSRRQKENERQLEAFLASADGAEFALTPPADFPVPLDGGAMRLTPARGEQKAARRASAAIRRKRNSRLCQRCVPRHRRAHAYRRRLGMSVSRVIEIVPGATTCPRGEALCEAITLTQAGVCICG